MGDDGFASRVIRCGADGQILFDTALPGLEGGALVYCFETGEGENAKYCLFGTAETPETKRRGIPPPNTTSIDPDFHPRGGAHIFRPAYACLFSWGKEGCEKGQIKERPAGGRKAEKRKSGKAEKRA